MPLTTAKNTGAIGLGGSNVVYLREVKSDGTNLTSPDTNHALGNVEVSEFGDVTEQIDQHTEDGELVTTLDDKRTVSLKFTVLETAKAHTTDLLKEVKGKFYRIYRKVATRDGKVQEALYGICRVNPRLELRYQSGEVTKTPVEVKVLKNAAQISIPLTELPSEKVTAVDPVLIAAGDYYTVLET